jgi:hypothetical protein
MELFERFVSDANPQGLHPLDEGRLADFVTATHRAGLPADYDEIRKRLKEANFDEDVARTVIDLVAFGLDVLKRYDAGLG